MDILPNLEALNKAANLAEIDYAIAPTPENKAKLDAARLAYNQAANKPVTQAPAELEAIAEFNIVEDDFGCHWIVRESDKHCFASQTALAWMCGVSQGLISDIIAQNSKCPKALLGLDFSDIVRVETGRKGRDIVGIPSDECYEILYYYANEARGSSDRVNAKELCKAMGRAGATAFIAKKAGYELEMSEGKLVDEVVDLKRRVAQLERLALSSESGSGKNQYGESPRDAYFRRRQNWSEMWTALRRWRKEN